MNVNFLNELSKLLKLSSLGGGNGPIVIDGDQLLVKCLHECPWLPIQNDKPVDGITEENICLRVVPLSVVHLMVFPAMLGVMVTLSCEV